VICRVSGGTPRVRIIRFPRIEIGAVAADFKRNRLICNAL
jgi:hypothetical protein